MPPYRKTQRRFFGPLLGWLLALGLACYGIWRIGLFRDEFLRDVAALERQSPADSQPQSDSPPTPEVAVPAAVEAVALLDPEERAGQIKTLLQKAAEAFEAQRFVESRTRLNEALTLLGEAPEAATVRQQLAALNEGIFLGGEFLPEDTYAAFVPILSGDTLVSIAQRHRITSASLAALNPGLDARKLIAGNTIKVVHGPFHARFVKQAGRLDVFVRDLYVYSCPAEMEPGLTVPEGTYQVTRKLQQRGGTWIGFAGVEPANAQVTSGWFYGSAGTSVPAAESPVVGVLLKDVELLKLYNVLSDRNSLLQIDP